MELFLVKGWIDCTAYGNDRTESFEDIRLVRALNSIEAKDKFENYWNSKTVEYSVYYRVSCEVMETIE